MNLVDSGPLSYGVIRVRVALSLNPACERVPFGACAGGALVSCLGSLWVACSSVVVAAGARVRLVGHLVLAGDPGARARAGVLSSGWWGLVSVRAFAACAPRRFASGVRRRPCRGRSTRAPPLRVAPVRAPSTPARCSGAALAGDALPFFRGSGSWCSGPLVQWPASPVGSRSGGNREESTTGPVRVPHVSCGLTKPRSLALACPWTLVAPTGSVVGSVRVCGASSSFRSTQSSCGLVRAHTLALTSPWVLVASMKPVVSFRGVLDPVPCLMAPYRPMRGPPGVTMSLLTVGNGPPGRGHQGTGGEPERARQSRCFAKSTVSGHPGGPPVVYC